MACCPTWPGLGHEDLGFPLMVARLGMKNVVKNTICTRCHPSKQCQNLYSPTSSDTVRHHHARPLHRTRISPPLPSHPFIPP